MLSLLTEVTQFNQYGQGNREREGKRIEKEGVEVINRQASQAIEF